MQRLRMRQCRCKIARADGRVCIIILWVQIQVDFLLVYFQSAWWISSQRCQSFHVCRRN